MKNITKQLLKWEKSHGLNGKQAGKLFGLTREHWSGVKHGRLSASKETILKIHKRTGVSLLGLMELK